MLRIIKKILPLLCIFTLLFSWAAFAYPPIDSGEVTGPWMEPRGSYSHHGLDVAGMPEGTPISAPCDGVVEGAFGSGYGYWVTITSDNGDCWLFGDCSPESENCPRGRVTEGTVIGYVGGEFHDDTGDSTGSHVHFEYHPFGYGNGMVDPTDYLIALGVNLNGYTGSGTTGLFSGRDDKRIPWTVEGMYEIGNDFNDIIKKFSQTANKAFTLLNKAVISMLIALCIIDFCLPVLMSGMAFSQRNYLTKLMKYAGLFGICMCWNKFTDNIVLGFVKSAAGTYSGSLDQISANMSQPQLLLQHGIRMIAPGINKISTFTTFEFLHNLGAIIPIYIFTFLIVFAFIALALYVTIVYVEFYVTASLSIVSVPFSAWRMSKFIAEGSVGHLVSSALKLLVVSVMIGLCVLCIKDSQPQEIFKQQTQGVTQQGTGHTIGPADLVALADQKAEKYQIPTNLFEAFIQTESSWNPNAVSGAGAMGLGQLMPGTAADLGCSDPFDPEQNLEASAKYIAQLYEMYGDWDYVMAAYNGGPGNVPKGEPIDPLYVEYINQVKSNMNGTYASHSSITSEQVVKYIAMCLSLLALVLLTVKVPNAIMKHLGGPIELRT